MAAAFGTGNLNRHYQAWVEPRQHLTRVTSFDPLTVGHIDR
jgi:hypothetical protein